MLEDLEPQPGRVRNAARTMADGLRSFMLDTDDQRRAAIQNLRLTDEAVAQREANHVARIVEIQFLHHAAAV